MILYIETSDGEIIKNYLQYKFKSYDKIAFNCECCGNFELLEYRRAKNFIFKNHICVVCFDDLQSGKIKEKNNVAEIWCNKKNKNFIFLLDSEDFSFIQGGK